MVGVCRGGGGGGGGVHVCVFFLIFPDFSRNKLALSLAFHSVFYICSLIYTCMFIFGTPNVLNTEENQN